MNRFEEFKVLYDRSADTLYILKRQEPATKGIEEPFGLVWRYGRDGGLIGVTILDFEDYWHDRHSELAQKLSQRFDIPVSQTRAFLDHVMDRHL